MTLTLEHQLSLVLDRREYDVIMAAIHRACWFEDGKDEDVDNLEAVLTAVRYRALRQQLS